MNNSNENKDTKLNSLIKEIIRDHQLDSYTDEEVIKDYIKDGIYDINNSVGSEIDYENDLCAKSLLKNYVAYAMYKKLSEFKELYQGEYAKLQIWYNRDSEIS